MKKHIKLLLCLTLAAILFSACGSGKNASDLNSSYKMEQEAGRSEYYTAEAEAEYSYKSSHDTSGDTKTNDSALSQSFVRQSTEKLVYTCSISMETLTFKETLTSVEDLLREYDGFVESETQTDSSSGWYYSDYRKTAGTMTEILIVRIPTENYDAFLSDLQGNGKIVSRSQNVDNITTAYNDTATTIDSLKIQEARLLEMMEKATNIEEMLSIEDRLTEVQTKLAVYESRLNSYDLDVAYSTITLNIREVLEYTPEDEPKKVSTFGDRLKNTLKASWEGFTGFLEGLLFFLIKAVPIMIVAGGIVFGIVLLIVRIIRKRKQRQ